MDTIANTVHHAADDTDIEIVTLRYVVVRPSVACVHRIYFAKMIWDPNNTL